jgi:hypothetical protein
MNAGEDNLDERKLVPPQGGASARPGSSPYRRHPIHLPPFERHNLPIIIFVTVCTADRRKILASPHAHEAILSAWHVASPWLVGRYVIMPDHAQFFCAPNELPPIFLGKMDALLEVARHPQPKRATRERVAATFLGSATAKSRKLR